MDDPISGDIEKLLNLYNSLKTAVPEICGKISQSTELDANDIDEIAKKVLIVKDSETGDVAFKTKIWADKEVRHIHNIEEQEEPGFTSALSELENATKNLSQELIKNNLAVKNTTDKEKQEKEVAAVVSVVNSIIKKVKGEQAPLIDILRGPISTHLETAALPSSEANVTNRFEIGKLSPPTGALTPSPDKLSETTVIDAAIDQSSTPPASVDHTQTTTVFSTDQLTKPLIEEQQREYLQQIEKMERFIAKFAEKSFDAIDFETFEEMGKLEAEATELLKKLPDDTPLRTRVNSFLHQLKSFGDAYNLLIELKELGELLKKGLNDPNYVPILDKFTSFISCNIGDLIKDIQGEQNLWKEIRKNIFSGAKEHATIPLKNRNITWITGSRSASIPLIEHVAKTALSNRPALVPTGKLLSHNIVPLTGELMYGMSRYGINRIALSGTRLDGLDTCITYADNNGFIFKAEDEIDFILKFEMTLLTGPPAYEYGINRLKIAVLRLLLMNQKPERWEELENHIRDNILPNIPKPEKNLEIEENWESFANLIGTTPMEDDFSDRDSNPPFKEKQIVVIFQENKMKFGMITGYDPKTKEYTILIDKDGKRVKKNAYEMLGLPKEEAENLAKKCPPMASGDLIHMMEPHLTQQERVNNILKLFNDVQPLDFSEESLSLVKDTFPIIWGSCTLTPGEISSPIASEVGVYGTAKLGEDIQVVFTDDDHVEMLRKAVADYDVRVFSFNTAKYLLSTEKTATKV